MLVGLSIANLGNEIQAGLNLLSRFCSYVNTLTTEGSEWQRSGGRDSGEGKCRPLTLRLSEPRTECWW